MSQQTPDTPAGDDAHPPRPRSFTGRAVRRKTRTSVKVADWVAYLVIVIGGLGVVAAFAGIVFYLGSVVVPLFYPPDVAPLAQVSLAAMERKSVGTQDASARRVLMGVDESAVMAWLIDREGQFSTYHAATGARLASRRIDDGSLSASAQKRSHVALGFSDGRVRFGEIVAPSDFRPALPEGLKAAESGATVVDGEAVVIRTPIGQAQYVRFLPEIGDAVTPGGDEPVVLVDYFYSDRLECFAVRKQSGKLYFGTLTKKRNMLTRKVTVTDNTVQVMVPPDLAAKPAAALMVGQNARQLYLIFPEGELLRYNCDNPEEVVLVERMDLLPEPGVAITRVGWMLGNVTLIVTDSRGGVTGWFAAPLPRNEQPTTPDKLRMVRAHELDSDGSLVTAIATSARDRQFITGDDKGVVYLRHMTSGTTQARLEVAPGKPIIAAAIGSKNDRIAALDGDGKLHLYRMNNPHADGKLPAFFAKIHYEGYAQPSHEWQSSAGTDDAELKFGLWPLIFGTIKATFYAMLIGVPIAILAAIYTSEFMSKSARSTVKGTIELMASLPSVVLGFVGALLVAPLVEQDVLGTLLLFAAIPVGVGLFAYLWQLVPDHLTRLVPSIVVFVVLVVVTSLSVLLTLALSGPIDRLLFGDFRAWLNGDGGPLPGWILLLTPIVGVGLTLAYNLLLRQYVVASIYADPAARRLVGVLELARFVATALAAVGLAYVLGFALTFMGFDIRGELLALGNPVGTYVNRNALLVGIFMGFAIIPIIYTVSEDALSSVPNTLRSASLGAGATPWQTAIRVVLPVATSGIFSACMIGFGRAAGETMIVLFISGRTPIIDLNIFNGMSALSANIATELPEAVKNSTHYRVLFMSAVVLFVMTFVVNTLAEVVRARFRKRAFQL